MLQMSGHICELGLTICQSNLKTKFYVTVSVSVVVLNMFIERFEEIYSITKLIILVTKNNSTYTGADRQGKKKTCWVLGSDINPACAAPIGN